MNTSSLSIDNVAFAKKGERASGQIAVSSCQRLMDLLQSQIPDNLDVSAHVAKSSAIDFSLAGAVDAQGRCFINLGISATLNTYCQRCLEPMSLPIQRDFHYLIAEQSDVAMEELSVDDSDECDVQEADAAMDVMALIEDELIMAMPIAPAHDLDCTRLIMQAGDKPNPFAVLKGLIKS